MNLEHKLNFIHFIFERRKQGKRILSIMCFLIVIFIFNRALFAAGDKPQIKANNVSELEKSIPIEIYEQINNTLGEMDNILKSSVLMAIPASEKQIVFIAPVVEIKGDFKKLISAKYKVSINAIETIIKRFQEEGKSECFYQVFLRPSKNVTYDYIRQISQNYEKAAHRVLRNKKKEIWYKLSSTFDEKNIVQ